MEKQSYSPTMHWLAVMPIALLILFAISAGQLDAAGTASFSMLGWTFFIIAFAATVSAYFLQRELLAGYPERLKNQIVFVLAAALLPGASITVGDLAGIVNFNDTDSTVSIGGLLVGLIVGYLAMYLCTLGNMLFILTHGENKVVKVFGYIVRVVAWIAVVVISYFGYGLAYSSHDPSTE